MRYFKLILALALLTIPAFAASARPDSLNLAHSVRGTVLDARSGSRLPSVNIRVSGKDYATVSNSDGVFVIKSDEPIVELTFSSLGYKTLTMPVTGPDVVARMAQERYLLDPSSIVTGEPIEIVRAADRMIIENYPDRSELLKCFYRETLQKRGRFISVAEAVTRVYKSSYYGLDYGDRVALDKSRILVSPRSRDTLSVKVQGGPTLPISADVVGNRELLLDDMLAGMYTLKMGAPAYIGDRLQFVIHFEPAEYTDYALFYGTLYIDREKLFFTRVEMSLDVSDPALATRQILQKKPLGLRFTPKEMSFVISYRYDGTACRMEYYRTVCRFNCDWKKRMLATNYAIVNETVVTDVIQPVVPIPRSEQFRSTDSMSDKAAEFLDPEFWTGYNIIEPTESLEHAAKRLHK
ncbi:MAG: carboxypeptidase-like regulatory domain-containing protein [Bacteroidales bacterium]|nr:carboxypeptidase-like regulatory domain-containing protein [Bacteroidales bacterium]